MTEAMTTADGAAEYVTAMVGGQMFGLPLTRVQDVFMPERLTRVPLSSPDVAGVLNLRGRIVTAIDMRSRLGLPRREACQPMMAVGVDLRGESYGLVIDSIGDVLKLPRDSADVNPVNMDAALARVSAGVHRLDGHLMVILDVEKVLDMGTEALAA